MPSSIVNVRITESQQQLTIDRPAKGLSVQGRIRVPGDKSISHRALMLGAIAKGETTIEGLLLGEDPRSTARCFQALGAEISPLNEQRVRVRGVGVGELIEPADILDAGNSGTTMRLMLGILASHPDRFFTVTGDKSLRSRPMSRVVKPLQQMGAQIWGRNGNSLAPLAVQGQSLRPIHYHSPIASAQVKSCILLAALMAQGTTTITEPAVSRDHSERMLKAFGAEITTDPDTKSVMITGPAQLQGQSVIVPGDISSAAFWIVAAAIVPDSDLTIENVGINPTRTGILEALEMMDADIQLENERMVAGEPVADIRVRHSQLKGCTISGDIIPRLIDEIPILAVAAIFAQGQTVISEAAELRVKESDRLAVTATVLNQMGAKITELPDGLEITGGTPLQGTDVESYDDHRIAMSLAIAALNAKGTTTIHHAEAAAISYPDFTATLRQVCEEC
ncbi:3-phosphoshikimate 1-carboxyvinyltransferase [Laspinema olomoucense]|uniref:3-phosphoshikimate 1-carboxyvinyltransferase n=1 Tax=Laspinema olomoucense D3b TaxID=2953688 RepID=A0ABT2NC00_9CYAN|nr:MULTISPECIES: 3-phosphoshikimate 1-carboxyvinyltransferase [unclassified Laspinema]MCT7980224.1 3-phosphoshikimate 1-carboxyvinyltransferase [Laspinema sp. D3b]MCT7996642.1 3-phosphoshikimate 1-carboxyvinyltransferase [Laspinema sp. D3c]